MVLTQAETVRYSRNIALPQIGLAGQEKVKNAKVLVVGAGGLGSSALLYLTAAGVGEIGIFDGDTVDATNLQRQTLFAEVDIGKNKAAIAAKKLLKANSSICVKSNCKYIRPEHAELVAGYDIVIDATDNFPTRYLLNDLSGYFNKPLISASLYQFEAQLTVFHVSLADGSPGPTLRCLYPEPPSHIPNCSEAGVIGALPGMVGSMQALEAIKLITGCAESLVGRLLILNALDYSLTKLNFKRVVIDDITPLPDWESYLKFSMRSCEMTQIEEITPVKLKRMLDAGEEFTLVDVREAHELEICNIGGVHIPLKTLPERTSEIPLDKPVVVYCRSGGRSLDACNYLAEDLQHPNVINLQGGILNWADQVDPSLPKY